MNKSIKSDCQAQKHTDVDHTQCIQSHAGIQGLYNVYIYMCIYNIRKATMALFTEQVLVSKVKYSKTVYFKQCVGTLRVKAAISLSLTLLAGL